MKTYNPEIWSDLDFDEKKVYQIYEAFQKEYNKLVAKNNLPMRNWLPSAYKKTCPNYDRDGKYPADDIREHDNWQIFVDIYLKYKHLDFFDPEVFVYGAFYYREKTKQIYPRMLLTQEAEKSYYRYLEKIAVEAKNGSTEEEIINGLKGTRITICKLLQLSPDEMPAYQDIYSLFNDIPEKSNLSKGILFCIHNMFSPYYLAISKSFHAAYKDLDPDVKSEIGFTSKEDFEVYTGTIRQYPKIYKAAKVFFDEDII